MLVKLTLTIFFLVLFQSFTNAQWFWQNPLPQANDLQKIKFVNEQTGWTIGLNGTILKTTNSGINWNLQNSNLTEMLNDLYIISERKVFITGNYGVILNTNDGGSSWNMNLLPEHSILKKIIFTDSLNGHICGYDADLSKGYIYKTTNGGIHWSLKASYNNEFFDKLFFWDSNTGIAGGDWYTYKTTDGGSTWERQNYTIGGSDITFLNLNTGFIVGGGTTSVGTSYGYISRTLNGGVNFHTVYSVNDSIYNSVHFINPSTGFVSGSKGGILKTTDGGESWFHSQSNIGNDIKSIHFTNDHKGFAAGSGGSIISTSSLGEQWTNQLQGNKYYNYKLDFYDNLTGWISCSNGITKTTDGGNSWHLIWDSLSYGNLYPHFYFNDRYNGWMVYPGSYSHFTVYKTTNGSNWSYVNVLHSNNINYTPYSVCFVNDNTGYITGNEFHLVHPFFPQYGFVYKTTDAGKTWGKESFSNKIIYDIQFIDSYTGYLAGDLNVVSKTTDGGQNWNQLNVSTGFNYLKVSFVNANTGWVLGEVPFNHYNNILLKTTDGGLSWEKEYFGENSFKLKSMKFVDSNTGMLCGTKGTVIATTNGGKNWIAQQTRTHQTLNAIDFINADTGWTCGENGTILKTTVGIIPVNIGATQSSVPIEFILHQNYPNPFNSATKIRFDFPADNFTFPVKMKLSIYNSLGKKVYEALKDIYNSGNYEIEFNGNEFSSGVYFYQITADNLTETKRMILLK